MAIQKYNGQLLRQYPHPQYGIAATEVSVNVYLGKTGTTPATLYDSLGTVLANPLTTGSDGKYSFYAEEGFYRLVFSNGDGDLIAQLFDGVTLAENVESSINAITVIAAGDFDTGFTVTTRNQTFLWPVSAGGNGDEYRWAGDLSTPKIVPENSTPSSSGGVSLDGWVNVGTTQLRENLKNGTAIIGGVPAQQVADLRDNLESDGGAANVNFGTISGVPNVNGLELASLVNRADNTNSYATGRLMSKIASGFGGTILVVSDSTGNETTEWVYRIAQKLSLDNSALTVNYRLWDVTNDVYLAPVIFGSGSVVLDIYNAAVSGSRPDYFYGFRFSTMIANISVLDLLIINHGHNLITQSSDTDTLRKRAPQLLELPAMLTRIYPGIGLIFVAQNPQRDNNNYEPVYRAIVDAAGVSGADLANVYSEFIRLGKPAELYNDNIHPNFNGQTIFLNKIYYFFYPSSHKAARDFIDNGADNLLYNGDFLDWGTSGPIGLITSGVTPSKETTIKETGAYSLKLTSISQGSLTTARFDVPNHASLAGSVVTLAVRLFIPTTNTDINSGRAGLLTNTDTTNNTSGNSGKGGWHWRFISVLVTSAASYLRAVVYCGSASTAGSIIYIDRMILCKGRLPCDNFPATQLPNYRYLNYTGAASAIDVSGIETLEIAVGYSGTITDLTGGTAGQFLRLIARGPGVSISGNTSGNIRHQHADRTVPLREETVYFARFDGFLWLILNPMPRSGCEFIGDESVTIYVGVNAQNQIYDTPLTANRSLTTGISGAQAGDWFEITRTTNATGGTLTHGATGAVISAGQWVRLFFTGTSYIVSARGSTV